MIFDFDELQNKGVINREWTRKEAVSYTHLDVYKRQGELTKPYGKKALIVTGRSSAKQSGLYDKVANSLSKAGIDHVLFDKVAQNPLTT